MHNFVVKIWKKFDFDTVLIHTNGQFSSSQIRKSCQEIARIPRMALTADSMWA
jgi:hypothetical protein